MKFMHLIHCVLLCSAAWEHAMEFFCRFHEMSFCCSIIISISLKKKISNNLQSIDDIIAIDLDCLSLLIFTHFCLDQD